MDEWRWLLHCIRGLEHLLRVQSPEWVSNLTLFGVKEEALLLSIIYLMLLEVLGKD
jgi:hypothetical protein